MLETGSGSVVVTNRFNDVVGSDHVDDHKESREPVFRGKGYFVNLLRKICTFSIHHCILFKVLKITEVYPRLILGVRISVGCFGTVIGLVCGLE